MQKILRGLFAAVAILTVPQIAMARGGGHFGGGHFGGGHFGGGHFGGGWHGGYGFHHRGFYGSPFFYGYYPYGGYYSDYYDDDGGYYVPTCVIYPKRVHTRHGWRTYRVRVCR